MLNGNEISPNGGINMTKTYYFKHENYGEDWQEWTSYLYDLSYVAEEIAEEIYNDDPGDAYDVDEEIEVKFGEADLSKKFKVSAFISVNFTANEIKA